MVSLQVYDSSTYTVDISPIETTTQPKLEVSSIPLSFPKISSVGFSLTAKKISHLNSLEASINDEIEESSSHLENQRKTQELYQELVDAIVEIESYSSNILYSASEQFFQGIESLEQVLPSELLDQWLPHQKLKNMTSIGSNLLTALDCGFQGFALLFRSHILGQSKELLRQQKSVQKEDLPEVKRQEVQEKIREWEVQIQLEEETLTEDKSQFKWDTASNALHFLNIPIAYLPKEWFYIVSNGLSWMTSALAVITTALSLKEAKQAIAEVDQWIRSYQEWQDHSQPKCNTSENQAHSTEIASSLLEKLQAIRQKKVLQLKPLFHTVEDKIKRLKRHSFMRDMQKLLERAKDPCCHFQEIEDIFTQWNFFDPIMSSQNQFLLTAFVHFKNAQKGNQPYSQQHQNLIHALKQWADHSTAMDQQFQHWFCTQDKDNLLMSYIDHEEVIEHITKHALKQMTAQKHALERTFLSFNVISAYLYFGEAVITLAVGSILALMGLLSLPFSSASLILCLLSIGSYLLSFGLSAASSSLSCTYRSLSFQALSYTLQMKMAWLQLRKSIQTYLHQIKEKKLLKTTQFLSQLHLNLSKKSIQPEAYQKAWISYQKTKIDFEQSQKKVTEWTQKLEEVEIQLYQKKWKDFAQYASLQTASNSDSFDTLEILEKTLQDCDFRLLSVETKTLLKDYLGINLETLQAKINQEPHGIKNALQAFFILDDAELLDFIKNQRTFLKKFTHPS